MIGMFVPFHGHRYMYCLCKIYVKVIAYFMFLFHIILLLFVLNILLMHVILENFLIHL